MEKDNQFSQLTIKKEIKKIPNKAGVYLFLNEKKEIIYVGKAAFLKSRVSSYFQSRKKQKERPIDFAISQIKYIKYQITETVLEAFFLEQELIKKFQPKYNVLGKDDKSFVYLGLTKEEFPRFEIIRKTTLYKLKEKEKKKKYQKFFGPFLARYQIETALKILRRIFPFHNLKQRTEKGCLDAQIDLCPAPFDGKITKEEYRKNIKGIEMILLGKKKNLVNQLEKEMLKAAQELNFEKAAKLRNLLFSLKHIQDVALINKNEIKKTKEKKMRIEAYDISNLGKHFQVGGMVVFYFNGQSVASQKNEYRKFKIKTLKDKPADVFALKEIIGRRFSHQKWIKPDLILVDGGKSQFNAVKTVLEEYHIKIPILAVAKGRRRKEVKILFDFFSSKKSEFWRNFLNEKELIAQIRDEAHRFAISYHRKLINKNFLHN